MGYKVISPETVIIDAGASIGDGATIYPNNYIGAGSAVGEGAVLYPNNIVENSYIGAGAQVTASVLRGARVGEGAQVGPFANLRQGAIVGENCRIGDFVELKNCVVGKNTKISHLAYVGDAEIGEDCNIGCGVVFCNYDGEKKSRTRVEKGCFIGSNANLVAPLTVGEGSYVAAGTTVTENVPARSFVIGRARQELNEKLAARYVGRKRQ